MNWEPANDFELAIVNSQPDCNFIYPALCDRRSFGNEPLDGADDHEIMFATEKKKPSSPPSYPKLTLIDTINKMTNSKPPGHQASYDDWKDDGDIETIEKESVAMMRFLNLEPDKVESFNEISTGSSESTKSLFSQIQWPSNGIFSKNKDKQINKKKGTTIFGSEEEYKPEPLNMTFTVAKNGSGQHQHEAVIKPQPTYANVSPKATYSDMARGSLKQINETQTCKAEFNGTQLDDGSFPKEFLSPKALYKKRRNKHGNLKSNH